MPKGMDAAGGRSPSLSTTLTGLSVCSCLVNSSLAMGSGSMILRSTPSSRTLRRVKSLIGSSASLVRKPPSSSWLYRYWLYCVFCATVAMEGGRLSGLQVERTKRMSPLLYLRRQLTRAWVEGRPERQHADAQGVGVLAAADEADDCVGVDGQGGGRGVQLLAGAGRSGGRVLGHLAAVGRGVTGHRPQGVARSVGQAGVELGRLQLVAAEADQSA